MDSGPDILGPEKGKFGPGPLYIVRKLWTTEQTKQKQNTIHGAAL